MMKRAFCYLTVFTYTKDKYQALKGYAYAVHKGVTLDAGEIRLFDITKYLSFN